MTVRHIPANGTQAAAQSVAALLVQAALRFYHVQRAGQGGDGGFLHRQEHAEIDLAAQLFKGGYHVPPAHKKADAGTGDVEAFGQAEELHAHIHGTRRIEEAVAHGPVKDNVAVGVIMDDENVILLAKATSSAYSSGEPTLPTGFAGRETIIYFALRATSSGMSFT